MFSYFKQEQTFTMFSLEWTDERRQVTTKRQFKSKCSTGFAHPCLVVLTIQRTGWRITYKKCWGLLLLSPSVCICSDFFIVDTRIVNKCPKLYYVQPGNICIDLTKQISTDFMQVNTRRAFFWMQTLITIIRISV